MSSLTKALAPLAVVLGLWLGFPNDLAALPLLAAVCPAGLAVLGLNASTTRRAFLSAWLWGGLGHILALHWLTVPMSRVGGLPLAVAAPCALFVALALATQGGLFALFARRFWRPENPLSALALALAWYFLEYGYALVAGFPWLPLSGALAVWPWTLQIADTLGATLAGSLWAGCALALTGSLLSRRPLPAFFGFVLAFFLSAYGVWQLARNPVTEPVTAEEAVKNLPRAGSDRDTFPVLLVEGNIDQNTKWVESYRVSTVNAYVSLTKEALQRARDAGVPAEYLERGVIVWPETAMPFDLARSRHTRSLMTLAVEAGMPIVTGAPGTERRADRGYNVYNRVWVVDRNGAPAGSYDKEHLVPFGEYVPSFFRWKFLEGLLQEVGAYTEGTRTSPLRVGPLAMGPLVCYEAVFPWLAQERVAKGANVLLDVSNDGWFGDTPAPHQHLALTGLRALEQNRWLVRCTNTGISAVYDNRGRIVFRGPQFRAEALWADARLESEPSRFHRLFHIVPAACAVLLGLCLFLTRDRRGGTAR